MENVAIKTLVRIFLLSVNIEVEHILIFLLQAAGLNKRENCKSFFISTIASNLLQQKTLGAQRKIETLKRL